MRKEPYSIISLKKHLATVLLLLHTFLSFGQQKNKATVVCADDFSKPLNSKTWITEIEQKPGATSAVYTQNGSLIIDTRGGVTVWLNKLLKSDIRIEYDRRVLVDSGKNDRLSDFNQFWMASDPSNQQNLFTRNGKFEAYDNLHLYYIGMGGNSNTTTRFRKYKSVGDKPVIKQYLDSAHLLQANKWYHIKIEVQKGTSSYWVNGMQYFAYTDPDPLTSGYFGFRSTWSRQEIRDFKISQLTN